MSDTEQEKITTALNKNERKFQYLQASLQGEALNVVRSLEISNNTYEVAWNLLKRRYDNKKLMISTHIKAIFNITEITKESHAALRNLCDSLQKHLRALEMLKQPVKMWDLILLHIMSTKLDYNTNKEWETLISKKGEDDMPTVNELIEFLHQRCRLLETIQKTTIEKNKNIDNHKSQYAKRKPERSAAFVATTEQSDPQFYNSSKIDLLLGAGIFYDLLLSGRIRGSRNTLTFVETTLGWIAGGQTCSTNNRQDSEHSVCKLTLEKQMELFWKIEELDETRNWSKEEQECEDHFVENFRRQPTGEFIVKLPFNHNKQKIGESKTVALKRFLTQEQRILHNKVLHRQYCEFMNEYESSGHMTPINNIPSEHYCTDNIVNS
ncbi:Protein of unknown function (DUF1759) [Popillia japonica]|uniref:Peptidase aspartic putative domain-containing protein n=1 Tax=Popillia japonica TaxID=7064 RepID=A0AAW1M3E0_POPJA